MEGQYLGKKRNISSSAMNNSAKIKRSKIGKILLKSYSNKSKIKSLIQYPEIEKISVTSQSTGADVNVEINQGKILKSIPATGLEISNSQIGIDSSESSFLNVKAINPGSAWNISKIEYKTSFSDGSQLFKSVVSGLSGDGTEETELIAVSEKISTPPGWLQLSN